MQASTTSQESPVPPDWLSNVREQIKAGCTGIASLLQDTPEMKQNTGASYQCPLSPKQPT